MSESRVHLWLHADVPERLLEKFLQYLRTFDDCHRDQCHFEVLADTHEMAQQEVEEILARLNPRLPFKMVFPGRE